MRGDRGAQLARSLTNQSPDAEQIGRIENIRAAAKAYGDTILDLSRPSREQALALTRLEESVMWSVKAIVLEKENT